MDRDEHVSYSAVAKIRMDTKPGFWIEVSPNPFKEGMKLNIGSNKNEEAIIILSDLSGKIILREASILKKGINAISVDRASQFAGGMCLLTVKTYQQRQTVKVLKE